MLRDADLNRTDFLGGPGALARGGLGPLGGLWRAAQAGPGGSPGLAALRTLRMSRVLALGQAHRRLAANPALQAHVAAVAPDDPLFWLSHRAYLAQGLELGARTDLALAHYGVEVDRFDEAYLREVYAQGGLALWRAEAEGVSYDLRLMPGNDLLQEGGLSVVLHVDGGRVCVLSFSWAPERIVLGAGGEAVLPFLTRKQLTAERGYQAAFNRAFNHVPPAHLCMAAACGVAGALGASRMVGIAAHLHPGISPDRRQHFEAAYDAYWASLGGERASPLGFVMEVPLRLTPVEALERTRRRRALARRGHMEAVRLSTLAALEARLRPDRVA